jgi:uncharacterized protein
MVEEAVFARIEAEARAFCEQARGSHGWDHTERVLALCLHIGRIEGADLEVLRLAALLHDIGRPLEDESQGRDCHAEIGARLARQMLEAHGLPEDLVARVEECVATHRFRGRRCPETLEAKILFDADKLDSIGAVGIGRAFLFAGEVGARLPDPKADHAHTRPYTADDTAHREFVVKLCRVKDRMLTAEGRRLACDRHDFMVAFFDRLDREVAGEV